LTVQARIQTLKERRAKLENLLAEEDKRPAPDSDTMVRLKREKLALREECDRLQKQDTASPSMSA
jgi:hypothetical protein